MNETGLICLFATFLIVAVMLVIYPLNRQHARQKIAIVIVLIVGSLWGYWQWGSHQRWINYLYQQDINRRAQAVMTSLKNPQDLIVKFKHHLQQHPNSARGWYLLGRLYISQHQSNLAHQAFLKAHQLEPANEQITVNYAQSMWAIHQQTFTHDVRELFQSILKRNPKQPDALSMLAMDAYQQHQYQQAIDYWSSLLLLLPANSSESKAIRQAIAKTQALHF